MKTRTALGKYSHLVAAVALVSALELNAQTLTNNLIFYAPFSGTLNDTVGARTGNGTNSPTLQASGGVGGGGYVQLQNDAYNPKQAVYYSDPTPATDDFSFQIWVRAVDADTAQNGQPDPDAAFASNKDWDAGANVGWVLAKQDAANPDQFQWNMNTVGGTRKDLDLRDPAARVLDGAWHQLLVTYQRSGNAVFYRDGLLVGTVNIAPNNGQSIRPAVDGTWITQSILALGEDATLQYDHSTGSAFNGDLDEATMWQRALTAEEAAAAFKKGVAGSGFGDVLPPVFVEQPLGGTRYASDNLLLSCAVADDRGQVSYQWYKDGAKVAYGTNRTVLLNDLKAGVANYTAVATDSFGSITSAPAVVTVLSTANITNGIAYYLPFENNLDGQAGLPITGTPIGNVAPRYVGGIIGTAVDFQNGGADGVTDWAVSLGDIEWVYTNNWSFSLWIKTTDTNDGANFGNKDWNSGGNIGWLLTANRPDINRSLNYTCSGGPRHDIGGADIHNGVWHHVVAVFNRDANTTYYYVDGNLTTSAGLGANGWQSLTPALVPNDTLIGSSGNGRWSGSGTMDDIGIWTRTLTADEVLAIYAEGGKGNPLTKAVAGSAVKPSIASAPSDVTQLESYPASFSVTASGTKPLSYQWRKGTTILTGQTNDTLNFASVSSGDAGSYTVVVTNQYGAATSAPPSTLTVTQLPSVQMTNALVVYLNFDNNIQGQAGTTINGTAIGDVALEKYTNGIISKAAQFNNDDSDSARASDWAVSLGDIEWIYTNNWSFSVWVKTTDNYGALLGNKNWYSGGNIGWCISEYYKDWLNYRADGGSARHDIGNFNWADDKWHNVAAVFYRDGNRVYTLVDGVVTAQAALSNTGLESLTPTDIMTTLVGSSGNTSESAYGAVDDLGIWTRPLSTKDIQAIYQSGLRGVPLPQATLSGPLTISYTASSTGLTLTYPAWAKDYTLESSGDLQPNSWTATGLTPQIVGDNAVVTIPFAPGNKFLRLRQ